uniref:Acid-sensing ion channel 2-like protein n=1 Tax=Callorhinchus milii TaxID=7868 RepID=A0A4W3GBF7_CALMI
EKNDDDDSDKSLLPEALKEGRGETARRSLWLAAFLVSLGLFCAWSSNRMRYLLSSPTHTTFHMAWAKNISFPAVTICNNNMLVSGKMSKSDVYLTGYWLGLLNKSHSVKPEALDILRDRRWSWFEKLLDFSHFLPPRQTGNVILKLLDHLGHQIEEMILRCKFQGRFLDPMRPPLSPGSHPSSLSLSLSLSPSEAT